MSGPASTARVLIANLNSPEMAHLGIELERRGVLESYVRPYVNRGRFWERAIERLPGVGSAYRRTLGRRAPPPGMPLNRLVQAGVLADFGAAAVGRLPLLPHEWRHSAAHSLIFAAERAVAVTAGELARRANVLVASYGTGRFAFETARRTGARTILSYPIAHNAYQARLYAQEAQLAPQFAAALPRMEALPREYVERLDVECELADRILVGSTFVRDSFVAQGYAAERIAIVPYGVDAQRFAPRAGPRRDTTFRVLFVGQIGQRKGMSYLLDAWRRFRRPRSELQLVGSFVAGREVYAPFAELFRHTPHVSQGELPALFHEADVFVLPSLVEGMPLVVLEAMACGVPVIVTPHGPADIVRDGVDGYVVPIRDPEAIAERLDRLHRDPSLRAQMGREARARALQFGWQDYARRTADVVLDRVATPRATAA